MPINANLGDVKMTGENMNKRIVRKSCLICVVLVFSMFIGIPSVTAVPLPFSEEEVREATEKLRAILRTASAEEVTGLIWEGAHVNDVGHEGKTPLMIAAGKNSNPDVLRVLIERGARVNAVDKKGNTSLIYAAMQNENPDVLRFLIDNGADAAIKNNSGDTAFDYAEKNEKLKTTNAPDLLHENASKKDALRATKTLLDLVESANIEEIARLIREGADVNAIDRLHWTPLMWAARGNKNPDVLRLLIENGAYVNAADSDWEPATPLTFCRLEKPKP